MGKKKRLWGGAANFYFGPFRDLLLGIPFSRGAGGGVFFPNLLSPSCSLLWRLRGRGSGNPKTAKIR